MSHCSVQILMEANPDYQRVKSWYEDPETKWFRIDSDLQKYRQKYDKPEEYYPSEDEKEEYISFVAHYRESAKKRNAKALRKLNSKPLREAIDVYKSMLKLGYSRAQLESRVAVVRNQFIGTIRRGIEDAKRKKNIELTTSQAIKYLGGYAKIVNRIFDRLSKYTKEDEYSILIRRFGEPKNDVQKKFLEERAEYNVNEYHKIAENKERFASLVARSISDSLGLVINHNGLEMSLDSISQDEADAQTEDTGGKGGERYIDTRTKLIMDTLSTEVKGFLSTIPMTEKNGKISRDDLLQPRYLDPRQIAYVLPEILRSSTPETMMGDLRDASDRYPFLTNLVNKLEGKLNPKDKDYQALIYTNFKRAAVIYGYVELNRGKYKANKANTRSQNNVLVRSASVNMGGVRLDSKWSIYDNGGMLHPNIKEISSEVTSSLRGLKEKLGFVNTTVDGFDRRKQFKKNGEPTNYKDLTSYSIYAQENGGEAALQKFLADNSDCVKTLTRAARGIGLEISEYQMRNAILSPVNKATAKIIGRVKSDNHNGGNRMDAIIDNIVSIYETAARPAAKDSDKLKYATAREVADTSTKEFARLNSALAVSFFDELEPRVLINGSSVQTYVYPNVLNEIMDGLNNEAGLDDDAYANYLEHEFLRYEDYTLAGKPVGWLKKLANGSAFTLSGKDGEKTGQYKVIHMNSFNHVEYSQLSITQKIAAQLVTWGGMNHAVEVPISADYENAWDFIQGCGIQSGIEPSVLDDIINERVTNEVAKYREETGKSMNFNEKVALRSRVTEQALLEFGMLRKPDGTLHTDWDVVTATADEVLIEINRINRLNKEYDADPDALNGPRVDVAMNQGMRFQIFPEFNNNGFLDKYSEFESDVDAYEFVKQQVAEQLAKIVDRDFAYLDSTKALSNPMLERLIVDGRNVSLYSQTGSIDNLSSTARLTLQSFFLDYFYGRLQMVKLINGGLYNFDGLLDYEKRNMMRHATRRPVYTEATWNGEKVGRETERAVYLEDEISESAYFDNIDTMLTALKDSKSITEKQYKRMRDSFKSHNATDGQAFRYYPSYRAIQIELGKWSDARERVYQYLMFDKGSASKDEIAAEMRAVYNQNEKPLYSGWEVVNGMKIPVLHKYSETVLFPKRVYEKLLGDKIPAQLEAMALAAENLSKEKPFDIFLFRSCVKVGCHTYIDPFGFEVDENGDFKRDENGNKIRRNSSAITMAADILDSVKRMPWAVHELPMKYYGEAASTPAHGEDDEISWSSQAEKDLWGNIEAGDKLEIDGEEMDSSLARDIYDEIDAATVAAKYKQVQEIFDDPEEMKDVLMEELAGKPYSSEELEFAISSGKVPYFYPSIARGAEQLFSAIIKKRMSRPKTKGANLLQVTSLGWDKDALGNVFGVSGLRRPRVVFDENGKFKYVEAYGTLNDSRLEVFADENGGISADRLEELVKSGIIPEEILKAVAYRTPSDELHSLIPIRFIGFLPKTMGANIIVPKEVMKMTGHDFDGDKLRVHYIDFQIVVDDDALYEQFLNDQMTDLNITKAILDKDSATTQSYNKYKKNWLKHSENYKKGMIQAYKYDYSKSAAENSQEARDNAKVQLAFAQLTSESGSHRLFIPGGSAETDVFGATFHIVRSVYDNPELEKPLKSIGVGKLDFSSVNTLYDSLIKLDGKSLKKLMDVVNDEITPYTFAHSNEAFDYMIGGKRMISVYALYASAGQMLQRLNLKVNQRTYKDKKTNAVKKHQVGFFNHEIDELYKIRTNPNEDGNTMLGTLTLSECINSAVDNGKNPRLGYLNQDPRLAEITNYLVAANLSAEQVHLILNQPVIIEALVRMKDQNLSFYAALKSIRDELTKDKANIAKYEFLRPASKKILELPKSEYISMMPKHYGEIAQSMDEDLVTSQVSLLTVLMSQNKYASLLSKFVKATRPEATSGGIASTVAGTMVITANLDELRDEILGKSPVDEEETGDEFDEEQEKVEATGELISGMSNVITPVEIYDNDSESVIVDKLSNSKLRRVSALMNLMQDKVYRFLAPYFPYTKEKWRTILDAIVSQYSASDREKEAIYRGVANEMILYNLMKSPMFTGDIQQEAQRLLIDFPFRLLRLKERVSVEKRRSDNGEEAQDEMARSLIDNNFLRKLSVEAPESEDSLPRIFFEKGGVVMDDFAKKITYDWAQMSVSPYEEIRNLALDLFKYNAFSSGFGFGMWEFSHFAPYTVLEGVPGYLSALTALRDNYIFSESADDVARFVVQYYMNHWEDERLVPRFNSTELPNSIRVQLGYKEQGEKEDKAAKKKFGDPEQYRFILIRDKKAPRLIGITHDTDEEPRAVEVARLGKRNSKSQMSVQYNPYLEYDKIEPYKIGTDSVWGTPYENFERNSDAADISGAEEIMSPEEREEYLESLKDSGRPVVAHHGSKVQKKSSAVEYYLAEVAKDMKKNDKVLSEMSKDEASLDGAFRVTDVDNILHQQYGAIADDATAQQSNSALFQSIEPEEGEIGKQGYAYLAQTIIDENGNEKIVTRTANWTPDVTRMAREQKAYYLLNKKLREEILPRLGVSVGVLTKADAILNLQGITDFSKATQVNAQGLYELIRLAEGFRGEEALPEEFGHLAVEMLGHEHPLVKRLLAALNTNESAMREAFEGQYDKYYELYEGDTEKLTLEAAGKLVAKAMLREKQIETGEVKPLIRRIIDAIKNMLRRVKSWIVKQAILDANEISGQLARDILSGRILDDMSVKNISRTDEFAQIQKDLNGQSGIIQRILQKETKRLALLQKRAGPTKRDEESAPVVATRKQIAQLENAIRNHKVESAIYDYMISSLQFLKETEASLDKKIASGDKVNSICKKLNAVRDTLYSYSSVMKLIDEAVESGEVIPSASLTQSMNDVRDEMNKFLAKYETLGMRFFERMLANVYGEHGVMRTLGPNKGKRLTIAEMARRGDRDISLITRMLSSIADCGDYVLAAFDDITRRAKMNGRQRAAEAHRRIVVAFDKLEKATGSKDQSFMYEYITKAEYIRREKAKALAESEGFTDHIDENLFPDEWKNEKDMNRKHKTGFYISEEKAKATLSKAQYEFYKEMMDIKQQIDACLPPAVIKSPYQIIALRKFGVDRIKGAEGIRGKLDAFGENMKNAILDTSADADNETVGVDVDFSNNKIDSLPYKYVTKSPKESWDDMTDDMALSVVAYASMGFEYDELNQVLAMLENARYMSMNREIEQSHGIKKLVNRIVTGKTADDFAYEENYTKKQMYTNLQLALDDFFQMHLYGKLQKEEGSVPGTKLSYRKMANLANAAASYTQMAFNLQQRVSNVGAGMMNIAVETAGKGAFNAADFAWATKVYMAHTGKRMLETGSLESDDKLSLFAERYDLHQNNGKFRVDSFKKNRLSRTFNTNLLFLGLNAGEDFLALTTALAIAHNTKVKSPSGKIETFFDAFEVKYLDSKNNKGAYLELKPGYTMADGSEITKDVEHQYAKLVIGTNFRLQGIYNSDDKAAIQQYALGSLVMMYRKWMHPALVRRYGKAGYNPLTGEEGEGYWRTMIRWIGDVAKNVGVNESGEQIALNITNAAKAVYTSGQLNWSKLTEYEKSNIHRALVEMSVLLGVCLALMLHSKFGPDKDQKEKDKSFDGWFTSFAVYQLFRLRNEIGSVAPTHMLLHEVKNTLSSPLAAWQPMQRILRIPQLLWPVTWTTEIKSGAFKGKSRAEKIIFELPVLSLYKQIQHVIDPTPLINYYKNGN